jgi:hypothetical protein
MSESRRRTSLQRGSTLLAACLLAASCRSAPREAEPPPNDTVQFIKWLTDDTSATAFYKTRVALTDCATQATEMTALWGVVVRPKLQGTRWSTITLWPEEPSGRSASFIFTRDASGAWRAAAPCLVTIAP